LTVRRDFSRIFRGASCLPPPPPSLFLSLSLRGTARSLSKSVTSRKRSLQRPPLRPLLFFCIPLAIARAAISVKHVAFRTRARRVECIAAISISIGEASTGSRGERKQWTPEWISGGARVAKRRKSSVSRYLSSRYGSYPRSASERRERQTRHLRVHFYQ